MATCPECDADIEVDEFDVDKGDLISCPDCGANLEVTSTSPVELEAADDDDDEEDDEEDEDFDEEEEDADGDDEEEEKEGGDWDESAALRWQRRRSRGPARPAQDCISPAPGSTTSIERCAGSSRASLH